MDAIFEAAFAYDADQDALSLTRVLPEGQRDTGPVDMAVVRELEKRCRDFSWNTSAKAGAEVGARLFELLNGDGQWLVRALQEADVRGACLQLDCRLAGPAVNLPFEVLWREGFLVPVRGVHVVRRVSDWGGKAVPQEKDRALRMLFMTCSPEGLRPVLDFEKEEEAIYDVTKDLAIDIDVEDTGSLEGLGEQLANNEYDVVHLSGHADIDNDGVPFFWMEDEEGLPVRGTPAQLWEKLSLGPPRLVFLSGCRTGETAGQTAAVSFAQHLVAQHSSTVLGWGLPVSDAGAMAAAERLYFDLSRGENILAATLATRKLLFEKHQRDWSLLRLFSDGTPLAVPLVRKGQKRHARARDLQYRYLHGSQVKVLTRGFVGRRRQIQRGLRCLRKDEQKIGLLLHGTGGLGKSCLAGKLCDRLKDHTLIIVHGRLADTTLHAALKDAFFRANDKRGLEILDEKREMPERIQMLCSACFQQGNYLVLLDDFEQNLENVETGRPELKAEAVPIVAALLRYLLYSGKITQLIITSRYGFSLTGAGADLVTTNLESIGLTSFRGADERKKTSELKEINLYPDNAVRVQLIEAGRGNPRLMEALNTLVAEVKDLDVTDLLDAVKDKQEEFVQELVLRRILDSQPAEFRSFVSRCAVYRLPVPAQAIQAVAEGVTKWESHTQQAVRLSLMEEDRIGTQEPRYWVTPLLREDVFLELDEEEGKVCHRCAAAYYKQALVDAPDYDPVSAKELIEHALAGGIEEDAIEATGPLLAHLRKQLAYLEARSIGEGVLVRAHPRHSAAYARLVFEMGWICDDVGEPRKAISHYEQALAIDKAVFGENHPTVAACLNNLGEAWRALGEPKKAIEYYEQALAIDKTVYGNNHPEVATYLNNLGLAWCDLGEPTKAIEYCEQALAIVKGTYGERHPHVAAVLNNLGLAWCDLGEPKEAIDYYEQALAIDKAVYGDNHPDIARDLNNLGAAWGDLGEKARALKCFKEAHVIFLQAYGPEHPHTKTVKEWLDSLGEGTEH